MHHSTKTSKLAIYLLAIGLTILFQVGAAPPPPRVETALTASAIAPLVAPAAMVAVGLSTVDASALMSVQRSVCDRCRTVCARNCSSYACLVCDRAPKCRLLVESCPYSPMKH